MVSRTYNAIIDAFNRLIAEKDFNKISVEMVMEKAGVSRSTFYRYFKDKYDVMNANYKNLLDHFIDPSRCSNYRELCFHLFEYGQKNLAIFKNALGSTGFNSFSNYIYTYSYEKALAITKANRNGQGFTPVEELQVDVFCNGICAVYKNMVEQRYQMTAAEAADALYEMMPESLKHYWWK
ncbi:MAG: TetR family transcriptional regulator [Firmicutes bacterium]|nr:TetR family transcriptional regulator [Bacillota bacterium]